MDYYLIKFVLFAAIVTLLFPLVIKRPARWVSVMIIGLALVPNSSIFTEERVTGGGFKLFFRYVGGVLSIWDILILIAILLIYSSSRAKYVFKPLSPLNRRLYWIVGIWAFAFVVGLAHATLLRYGFTSITNVVQQMLPSAYFLISIIIVKALVQTERDINQIINVFSYCNVVILIEGAALLSVAAAELIPVVRGVARMPIVVYDGLGFLTIGLLITFAKYCFGEKTTLLDKFIFVGGIFFLLTSTRRMNLLLLIINLLVIYLVTRRRIFSLRTALDAFKTTLVLIVPSLAILYIFAPQYFDIFSLIAGSFDLSSEAGEASGGLFRLAQISNLFLNMNTEAPFSYIWGMGFGTQWYEFVPLVGINPEGDAGYIASLQELGAQGWWPYFHLSNISTLYRFGIAGILLVLTISFRWLRQWTKALPVFAPAQRPAVFVIALVGFEYLIVVGDSTDSAWPALIGILFGLLEAMNRTGKKAANGISLSNQQLLPA